MNPKFSILYIIAGSVSLLFIVWQLIEKWQSADVNYSRIVLNLIMSVSFFYLAYKTYHEKKDNELM